MQKVPPREAEHGGQPKEAASRLHPKTEARGDEGGEDGGYP
jgi:hypothetical protein